MSATRTSTQIARTRLANQLLGTTRAQTPRAVVQALAALQAQDYQSALWAIGVRTRGATLAEVEPAFAAREIVRSWPLRGTLQIVLAEDLPWMLALTSARRIQASKRSREELELTPKQLARAERLLGDALGGGKRATRDELLALWERHKISTQGQRGYHMLVYAALRGVICFGPRQGNRDTFVLLEEWLPKPRKLAGDEALAELARRYLASRAPAGPADFAWWAGLTLGQARAGLALAGEQPPPRAARVSPGDVLLLPGFDEYLLGYADRSAVLASEHASLIAPGKNGIFLPTLVVGGRVAGTWRARKTRRAVEITLAPFNPLSARTSTQLARAAQRYGAFLGLPVSVGLSTPDGPV
jgi:hypothetical protein